MASESSKGAKVYKKRPHRKVKSGCTTCKRRKIKCDEEKPQCSNCVRYSSECIYPSTTPAPSESSRDQISSNPGTPPLVRTPESLGEDPPFQLRSKRPASHELPLRDLALLHQWTVSTCFGFGDFPGDERPWQVDVPIMGQSNPFLMRGILSISALHLARLTTDPEARFRNVRLAAYHQDLALPEYRAALSNVTEHNCAAIISFSVLITVYSFAAPNAGGMFSGGAPEWVFLHRGVANIPDKCYEWLDHTPQAYQLRRRRALPVLETLNPDDFRLVGLHGMLTNLPDEEQAEAVHYEDALHWLRQAFALTFSEESKIGPKYAVLFWVEHVDEGYLELLSMRKPRALILLAHCAILLERASRFWYLEGFAQHVITEMKLYLGEEYLPWIEWPLQECRMR